ncbi:MAG: hypothetical protein WC356_04780 [Candidatus Micrarchaeia archaeon]
MPSGHNCQEFLFDLRLDFGKEFKHYVPILRRNTACHKDLLPGNAMDTI